MLAIRQEDLNIPSVLIIRDGLVVVDTYFSPCDGKTVHEFASVTKSLMTTLITVAAEQDNLKLDQSMASFFSERTTDNLFPVKNASQYGI